MEASRGNLIVNMKIYYLCFLAVILAATIASVQADSRPSKKSASTFRGPKNVYNRRKLHRKGGKAKANRERKKRRMGRKNKVNGGRKSTEKKSRARVRSGSVSDICLEQSLTVMKMWKDVISNLVFKKKKKRCHLLCR